jgi:HEAT repeat protein
MVNGVAPGVSSADAFQRAVAKALLARAEHGDDGDYWAAVRALQQCDPAEVWTLVVPLASDPEEKLRALVPDTLRFLGGMAKPLRDETVSLLGKMLQAPQSRAVLCSIALAFVDLSHEAALELLLPLRAHSDEKVRSAVIHGILPVAHGAVQELIELSRDESDEVRDWATFGLGSQLGYPGEPRFLDTPEIRAALVDRLADPHAETRAEATLGLAYRHDERAIPVIAQELGAGTEFGQYVEAAEVLGDDRLLEPLAGYAKAHSSARVARALAACDPQRQR